MKGYFIGILEIVFFLIGSIFIRKSYNQLQTINNATYFWVMLTILTGIWEVSYIYNYENVTNTSRQLVNTNQHVWTNSYDISYILPWKLSHIFYAEYGAWADREYMSNNDNWSRVIEGTHCSQCALFSLLAITFKLFKKHNNYLICLSAAMGTQLMNSYLYMCAYFWQEREPTNINYPSTDFPSDIWLVKRPFMWVNIFWLVMPGYIISLNIFDNLKIENPIIDDLEKNKLID
jgi:hypothetical protein